MKQDVNARVAMETGTKTKMVVLLGETTVTGPRINYEQVARDVCGQIGYDDEKKGLDYKNTSVVVNVEGQS